jgi:3',5'-nucleoside bisphosphate phosphatase
MRADLHVHTTYSDGTLTPTEAVRDAARAGLSAVAITDHDTTAGLDEASAAAAELHIELVPGVEINTEDIAFEVHILGYFMDHRDEAFSGFLLGLRRSRIERGKQMLAKLRALGIPISFGELVERDDTRSLGRPHIAKVIVEKGFAPTARIALSRYLKKGAPAHVPRESLPPRRAVEAIVAAGGVPVFAHPGLVGRDDTIRELVECGLGGIEVDHPEHTPAMVAKYRAMADELSLIATGGSDSHGEKALRTVAIGESGCEAEVVEALRATALRMREGICK